MPPPPARSPRPLVLGFLALLLIGGALAGCEEQRSDNNPFVGTSGAAIEAPYGDGITPVAPDSGASRP
jgi:hypothetical protein